MRGKPIRFFIQFFGNNAFFRRLNLSSANGYQPLEISGRSMMSSMSRMSSTSVKDPVVETDGAIENLGEMLFMLNNSGNIQHLTSINSDIRCE